MKHTIKILVLAIVCVFYYLAVHTDLQEHPQVEEQDVVVIPEVVNEETLARLGAAGIQFLGSSSNTNEAGTALTVDLSGLGLQQNDLVIAVNAYGNSNNANYYGMSSAGWTSVTTLKGDDTYDVNMQVWYKVMGASPDTSFVTNGTGAAPTRNQAAMGYAFRNVNTASPLDVAATSVTGTNSATPDPASITPVTAGSYVVAIGAQAMDCGGTTPPSGYSNNALVTNTGTCATTYYGATIVMANKAWTSGAEDPGAWSGGYDAIEDAFESWASVTLALRGTPPEATSTTPSVIRGGSVRVNGGSMRNTKL